MAFTKATAWKWLLLFLLSTDSISLLWSSAANSLPTNFIGTTYLPKKTSDPLSDSWIHGDQNNPHLTICSLNFSLDKPYNTQCFNMMSDSIENFSTSSSGTFYVIFSKMKIGCVFVFVLPILETTGSDFQSLGVVSNCKNSPLP